MKQLTTTITILALAISSLFAQSPQTFNYQTIVRDVSGSIVANQAVSFQMSILEDNATGTVAYTETHSVTTNQIGLVNLQIGNGTLVSGTFAGIDWPNHNHYLQVEFDIAGGTTYTLMGTKQLLSVPYVLHAASATNDKDEQTLSLSGDTLFISNGNFIVIPGFKQ